MPEKNFSDHRWTIDYPEDFQFLEKIVQLTGVAPRPFREIVALVEENSELKDINTQHNSWKKTEGK
jgi:spore coat polysaccharide biosynthesis protein SpsF (cytidylyltransferase family)